MIKIVSVKFKNSGKQYYFAPGNQTYEKGMGVIVETAKGQEYATVVQPDGEVEESAIVSPLKPVIRIATERDEEQVKRNAERRTEALKTAQEKIAARGLEMKLVDCEFAFDGSKVVFYFTSESRVDFRELIKDLSSAFHMRIELRQINIRDEIKITGGLAPCGRECCCIGCMSEPKKVSVKMAKNQGLSLNPTKISGLCGRLMCCLAYENEYYAEACKKVPKIGSEADTPDGKGTVVNVNMLKMLVKVKIEQNDAVSYHEYPVNEIRFMRGNVVMGKEEDDGEDGEILPEDDGVQPESAPPAPEDKPQRDRERNRNRNRDKHGANRGDGSRQNGAPESDGQKREKDFHGNKPRGNGERRGNQNNQNGQNNRDNRGDRGERAPNQGKGNADGGRGNGQQGKGGNNFRRRDKRKDNRKPAEKPEN